MVRTDEFMGGCANAPRRADGTAAEDILWRQPHQYLIDDDPIGQVVEDGHAAAVSHGDWPPVFHFHPTNQRRRKCTRIQQPTADGRAAGMSYGGIWELRRGATVSRRLTHGQRIWAAKLLTGVVEEGAPRLEREIRGGPERKPGGD